MQKLSKDPIILSDYYYAPAKKPETLSGFSYINHQIPDLEFSEDPVRVKFAKTKALYFQDPEKLKEIRFIYTKFQVDAAQEVLFSTISHSTYKIWLNGLYVGANTGFELFTFYLNFQPGENTLVFEVNLSNPKYYDFNNRIVLQSEEEKNPKSFLCGTCLEYEKGIQFFQTSDCRESNCSCIFVPRCYRIIQSASVSVSDDFGNLLTTVPAEPGVPLTFSTEELKVNSPQTVRLHLLLEIFFTDGTSTTRKQMVLVREYSEEKEVLRQRWAEALKTKEEYTRNFLYNEYNRFFDKTNPPSLGEAAALFKLDKYLKQMEASEIPYYLQENNTLIYYRSAYDLQYRKIRICTPPKLSVKNPGLVVFVNPTGNSLGVRVAHLLKNHSDLILIDISVAGFSTGNAVSESLITEALSEVRKIYAYNDRRIYWYGFCNNGFAIWSYCQNHPDLATYICSVESMPDSGRIKNLDHCLCRSYYWNSEDYKYVKVFKKIKNNQFVKIQKATHNYMQYYLYRAENFQHLKAESPEYPQKVRFSTSRLRFNKSFWITLNSIRRDKMTASVKGEIVDSRNIRIRLLCCDDFSINVPPQMEKSFTVEINGVRIPCEKTKMLRFVRNGGQFHLAQEVALSQTRKGTGLLDVYYGPLRIVHDGSSIASEIAENFAKPEAMSFSPKLQVKFPSYAVTEFFDEEQKQNLVLINVDEIGGRRLDLPVHLFDAGYKVDDETYTGKYCVLQVIPNPENPSNSILHIGSNDLETFKNHLFLRKIVLPSMLTGISPYWNVQAISITEDGMKILCKE